jgi:hypothetical protein
MALMLTYNACSYWFKSRIMITSSQQITFGVDELEPNSPLYKAMPLS